MFEVLKKGLFTGIGLASLTKEKLEELSRDIARHAKLSEDQAKDFSDELSRRAAQARNDLSGQIDRRLDHLMIQAGILKAGLSSSTEDMKHQAESWIDRRIDEAFERLNIARAEEIEALEARLALLEKKLAQ